MFNQFHFVRYQFETSQCTPVLWGFSLLCFVPLFLKQIFKSTDYLPQQFSEIILMHSQPNLSKLYASFCPDQPSALWKMTIEIRPCMSLWAYEGRSASNSHRKSKCSVFHVHWTSDFFEHILFSQLTTADLGLFHLTLVLNDTQDHRKWYQCVQSHDSYKHSKFIINTFIF